LYPSTRSSLPSRSSNCPHPGRIHSGPSGAASEGDGDALSDALSEAEPDALGLSEAEPEAEGLELGLSEADPEADPEALALALPDAEGDSDALPDAEAEADPLAEAEAEAEALAEAEGLNDADPDADAEADAEAEPDADGDSEALPLADAEAEALADADALGESEADPEAEAEADALALGLRDAEPEADALADAEPAAGLRTSSRVFQASVESCETLPSVNDSACAVGTASCPMPRLASLPLAVLPWASRVPPAPASMVMSSSTATMPTNHAPSVLGVLLIVIVAMSAFVSDPTVTPSSGVVASTLR
jgi:hypothetical protein